MNTQDEIIALIRTIRHRTGLTQEKLAARLGVTFPTVNRWEHGRAKPSPLAIQKIKELVGSMGNAGADLFRTQEPSYLIVDENRTRLQGRQEIVFFDKWPVLEQGTD